MMLALMIPLVSATGAEAADTEAPPYLGLIEVGRPFPGLWLPAASDGRPMSVAQFRGRRLVLHVFASW
jgi:hypothetical protein